VSLREQAPVPIHCRGDRLVSEALLDHG
jgi:hypothetical protein